VNSSFLVTAMSEYFVKNYIKLCWYGKRFIRQSLEVTLNCSHEHSMRLKTKCTCVTVVVLPQFSTKEPRSYSLTPSPSLMGWVGESKGKQVKTCGLG